MSYRLPSLNGLRAFEAAARHLSFKAAAGELGVTPGAVSQQVKGLETSLGVSLFRRLPRGLLLTPSGEAYLPAVSAAFRSLSQATEAVAPAMSARKLRIGVGQTVASALPRLAGNLDPTLAAVVATRRPTDDLERLRTNELDAVVRFADTPFPGFAVEPVCEREGRRIVLVCLPGLADCLPMRAVVAGLRSIVGEGA